MAAKAGRLQIQLEMQVAQLQRDLDKATRDIDNAANNWKSTFKGVFTADLLTNALQQVGGAVSRVIDDMGRIADESRKLGDSAEMFQRLNYAAEQTGVSMDAIVSASGRLQKQLGDGGKAATDAINALGLSVEKLRSDTTGEAFIKVAGALGELDDKAQQAALGAAIFGKGWQALLPMIDDGEAALRRVTQQAVVASDEAVKAADDFGDMIARGQSAVTAFIAEALAPLLPLLTQEIEKLTETGEAARGMGDGFDAAKTPARQLGETLAQLAKWAVATGETLDGVMKLSRISGKALREGFNTADVQRQIDEISNAWSRANTSFEGVQSTIATTGEITDKQKEAVKAAAAAAEAAAKAADEQAGAQKRASEAARAKSEADRKAAAAARDAERAQRDAARAAEEAAADAEKAQQAASEQADKLTDAINDLTEARMRNQGATENDIRLWRLWVEGADETTRAISDLNQEAKNLDEQTAADSAKREADRQRQFEKAQQLSQTLEAGIHDIFGAMTQGSEEAAEAVARLAAELIAAFLTAQALKALGLPGTGGLFQAAKGAAFDARGLIPFAQGGIVHSPTPFTFGGGRRGVMGEAGPEAILPLGRDAMGRLGVRGGGVNVSVHNYGGSQISVEQRGDEIAVIVDQVRGVLANDVARGGNVFSSAIEGAYGVRR